MSTLRVLCRLSGVATSPAYLQAFRGWRDPDSNRGHHDFQSLRPRRREARNPWKASGSGATRARRRCQEFAGLSPRFRGWLAFHPHFEPAVAQAVCLIGFLEERGSASGERRDSANRRPEVAASVRRLNSATLAARAHGGGGGDPPQCPSCMERDSCSGTAAFHGCRSAVGPIARRRTPGRRPLRGAARWTVRTAAPVPTRETRISDEREPAAGAGSQRSAAGAFRGGRPTRGCAPACASRCGRRRRGRPRAGRD